MRRIKAILFDNDGTLADTHDMILVCMRHAMTTVLPDKRFMDDELMSMVGLPLYDQMVVFAGGDESIGQQLTDVYRERNHAIHDQLIKLYDGVLPTLATLKEAGIAMGVVTSKMAPLCQRGLNITGAAPYLDCLVAPDNFPIFKPEPDPILEGCRRLGSTPEETAYVGDSPFDMHAGIAAGTLSIACTWGMFGEEALKKESPDHVIRGFRELLDVPEIAAAL